MNKRQKILITLTVVFAAVFLTGIFMIMHTSTTIPFEESNIVFTTMSSLEEKIAGTLIAMAGGSYLGIVIYLLCK